MGRYVDIVFTCQQKRIMLLQTSLFHMISICSFHTPDMYRLLPARLNNKNSVFPATSVLLKQLPSLSKRSTTAMDRYRIRPRVANDSTKLIMTDRSSTTTITTALEGPCGPPPSRLPPPPPPPPTVPPRNPARLGNPLLEPQRLSDIWDSRTSRYQFGQPACKSSLPPRKPTSNPSLTTSQPVAAPSPPPPWTQKPPRRTQRPPTHRAAPSPALPRKLQHATSVARATRPPPRSRQHLPVRRAACAPAASS